MAQQGSFCRAMQPQLRVASCASAVILSIQCVNLHYYLTFASFILYFGIIFVSFQNKIANSAFFIVNYVTLQQISEIKSKIV